MIKIPIPKPKKGEEKNKFISRCMSNETMKNEFSDQKRRSAVCYDSWRKNKNYFNIVSKHYEVEKKEGNKVSKDRFIEVPISGLKEDRDNEKMSEEAIKKMINRLKEGVPLHINHGSGPVQYSWEDIAGKSVGGKLEGENLIAKFRLNKYHPKHELMWNYLQEKMPVGFSIGAKPIKNHTEEIKDE